jgi:hypothetical protein
MMIRYLELLARYVLTNSSSGMSSLVQLPVHHDYLYKAYPTSLICKMTLERVITCDRSLHLLLLSVRDSMCLDQWITQPP